MLIGDRDTAIVEIVVGGAAVVETDADADAAAAVAAAATSALAVDSNVFILLSNLFALEINLNSDGFDVIC